ncbi:DUF3172 domain-containing protein [Aliterella atlantica]|uniref:DUF3172 domain-containing protein n=1 Tax=Aliterella atlantica CENA595 TaxID=1618023 RepID=A0A0D8ZMR1_9CYAN|nr:DUF3172 domain-containing protein [Aliterella atlantica]KJH70040.1 hypothetical protein UH38_20655 [Aliterella atlantica CENA595]
MKRIAPSAKLLTRKFWRFNFAKLALLAAIFILGSGAGIAITSTITFHPANVASREFIDISAPNPEICAQYGASAMVIDARFFVTMNPFHVFVSQSNLKPGCVLRMGNWQILEQRRLITADQVRDCRNSMNTFGFIGELENSPDIRCVYQNDNSQNLFLNQPGLPPPPSTENF